MSPNLLVFPMFAMVLLTFSVLIRMFRARTRLVREGQIDPSYFLIYQGQGEPEASAKLARHFTNLHEAPLLFHVGCVAAMALGVTGVVFLVLAWAYVATRVVHTVIHTGRNRIWPRVYAYLSSWIVLLSMWVVLAVQASMAMAT